MGIVSCTAFREKAVELLLHTSCTVQMINEKVGIVNTNYFYSLFKKKYGMTPLEYRKNHQ